MFNTKRFGAFISRLRKNADMTQSELAEQLNEYYFKSSFYFCIMYGCQGFGNCNCIG